MGSRYVNLQDGSGGTKIIAMKRVIQDFVRYCQAVIPNSVDTLITMKARGIPANDTSTKYIPLPVNVGAIVKKRVVLRLCHGNSTDYPFYARIQPIRYMMDRHVQAGKGRTNFNEFGAYSSRKRRRSKLRAIGEERESLEEAWYFILLPSFHRNAILSKEIKQH